VVCSFDGPGLRDEHPDGSKIGVSLRGDAHKDAHDATTF